MDKDWITPSLREMMSGEELKKRYTKSIQRYNESIKEGDFFTSFMISSSLYEERLNVCFLLCMWEDLDEKFSLDNKPNHEWFLSYDIKAKARFIQDKGYINNKIRNNILFLAGARNNIIHLSFYNYDNKNLQRLSEKFFELFRQLDKVVSEIKKKIDG